MTRACIFIMVVAGATWAAGALPGTGACFAAGAETAGVQDDMRDLKQRFEERYRRIVRAKSEGKVGETFDGFLAPLADAFVKNNADLAELLKAENEDREKLYDLLAKDVKSEVDETAREKVTPQIVAERNAKRNFRNAKDDEFLRMEDGVWIQKRDERAYEAITKLKEEGAARERDDGYLAVEGADAEARRVVETENDRRRAMYEEVAKTADSSADAIAREHAEERSRRNRARD